MENDINYVTPCNSRLLFEINRPLRSQVQTLNIIHIIFTHIKTIKTIGDRERDAFNNL